MLRTPLAEALRPAPQVEYFQLRISLLLVQLHFYHLESSEGQTCVKHIHFYTYTAFIYFTLFLLKIPAASHRSSPYVCRRLGLLAPLLYKTSSWFRVQSIRSSWFYRVFEFDSIELVLSDSTRSNCVHCNRFDHMSFIGWSKSIDFDPIRSGSIEFDHASRVDRIGFWFPLHSIGSERFYRLMDFY